MADTGSLLAPAGDASRTYGEAFSGALEPFTRITAAAPPWLGWVGLGMLALVVSLSIGGLLLDARRNRQARRRHAAGVCQCPAWRHAPPGAV